MQLHDDVLAVPKEIFHVDHFAPRRRSHLRAAVLVRVNAHVLPFLRDIRIGSVRAENRQAPTRLAGVENEIPVIAASTRRAVLRMTAVPRLFRNMKHRHSSYDRQQPCTVTPNESSR